MAALVLQLVCYISLVLEPELMAALYPQIEVLRASPSCTCRGR